ncbi:beta-ketoacyl synthase N-terminal-like domain-containing protein, partial [Streptomyces carpinensis]
MPEVPIHPYAVTAGEVVPGDLFALSQEEAERQQWCVVMHTLPESPETIRVTLRPPLGGLDREAVLAREQQVFVAGRRVDVAAVPAVSSPRLDSVEFHDGDRVTRLRAVDPEGVEVTYERRWGAWHRDLDDRAGEKVSDDVVRGWAADADRAGYVVRHHSRPTREASWAGPRRVVVTGLGALTPLGVGVDELWRGLLDGRHGIRELEGEEFQELPVRIAGVVPVDPGMMLSRAAARRMN